ncbi:hypothetical protein DDP54_12085 [Cellulomonas sp. WB94]|uniref:hypothetical protein n=1 Tax=Cellulomonas sp. WB94 TaxID=2173174 RepID=UPI000D57D075|nr:hypothetical protein [Cellulomonas sp. WB94]PVU83608.1 hypothetical protein DDP54_12085 [Cellulomonas sp. WB94]
MPLLGHLQLTSVLRGLRGPTLPAEQADQPAPVLPVGIVDRVPADLHARALLAGAPAKSADALVDAVSELDARERAQVTHPLRPAPGTDMLRLGTAAARQTDGTTCGSSVLAMLAAAGDPPLAYWLVTGRTLAGYRPAELDGVDDAAGPAVRFGDLQQALKARSTARAVLGLLPWPRALGTPPWGAARVARFPGVAYRSVLVDDTRSDEVAVVLARAARALDRGVPVPLYTGGDLSMGLATAIPRHVVLLTARTADGFTVYEPSSGRLLPLTTDEVTSPGGPVPALGGWSHACWALLPVRP